MKLEEYLEELFEELYQEAKERFKNDIRYVYASSDIEAIHFEWKEHYSQQEEKYLEKCLTVFRTYYLEEEQFLYRQGIRDCIALLKHLQVLA